MKVSRVSTSIIGDLYLRNRSAEWHLALHIVD